MFDSLLWQKFSGTDMYEVDPTSRSEYSEGRGGVFGHGGKIVLRKRGHASLLVSQYYSYNIEGANTITPLHHANTMQHYVYI